MTFDFEKPNFSPTDLVVHASDSFVSDMQRVSNTPPNYDSRSLDEVQLFDPVEKLDKLDAYAVANHMLSDTADKYSKSDTHKHFTQSLKQSKQR